ncbi:hypothetical protein RHMOL_Rhmol07G0205200 [Rhododendron molle]|uniref:Uncharacterized protein n=1 Tax=Rhododendron molle TaxID=49168 RepID=A0ACC0N412_RHOML|nr:hypothetical protein RHMOL_Rhmol07G0205200 [Rhododendron molle]
MNPNMKMRHARAFLLSDVLCLPSGASKNEQRAPHRRPGVVISEQGFSRVPGRARVKKLAQDYRIRLATWNIGSLTGKTRELVDTMLRRRIGIACLQETKWVGEKAREIEDTGYKLYYMGDFNGHVGVHKQGYEKVHGGFGFGDLNGGGRRILDFAVAFDLIVGNTLYRKREEHLITFKSGANKSQIDYFLARGADLLTCKDCKVFKERMSQEVWWGVEGDSDTMWNTIADGIRRISKEVLGESKGKGPISKETWWWNDEVQTMVKAKKECFKKWQKDRNAENF